MAPRLPSLPSVAGKIINPDGTPAREWVTFFDDLTTYIRTPSLESKTFAQLPAAASNTGVRYLVTNSNTAVFNATVAGGGANIVPVFSNGTDWKVG